MTRGTVFGRAAVLALSIGTLLGAPAAAASYGRVAFTKMAVDKCEDFFGTCEWKLTCRVGGGAETEILSAQPGGVAQDIELNKSFPLNQFPARMECSLAEDDGWFGETWADAGKVSLEIPGGGDYVLDLNGDQGQVLITVAVDSIEVADGASAAPATTGKAAKKPAKPAAGRDLVAAYNRDSSGHAVVIGLPWDAFKARVDTFAAQGVKLTVMQHWEEGGQRLWSGIFRSLEGNQELVADVEWDPFVVRYNKLVAEGMSLASMEIYPKGNKFQFVGVYHEGGDENPLWIGQERNAFITKWSNLSGGGSRLADLEIYKASGKMMYAGVFRGGSGPYGMWNALTWAQLQEKWGPKEAEGRTSITDLVSYNEGGKKLWDVTTGGGAGRMTQPMNAAALAKDWNDQLAKGFRLAALEAVQ